MIDPKIVMGVAENIKNIFKEEEDFVKNLKNRVDNTKKLADEIKKGKFTDQKAINQCFEIAKKTLSEKLEFYGKSSKLVGKINKARADYLEESKKFMEELISKQMDIHERASGEIRRDKQEEIKKELEKISDNIKKLEKIEEEVNKRGTESWRLLAAVQKYTAELSNLSSVINEFNEKLKQTQEQTKKIMETKASA